MTSFLGALIEAWEEVKINRARVILSLIGVGAAVWAMATVLALGSLLTAAQEHMFAQYDGVRGTITLTTTSTNSNENNESNESADSFSSSDNAAPSSQAANSREKAISQYEHFRTATEATIKRINAKYWTIKQNQQIYPDAPDYNKCYDEWCTGENGSLIGVNPAFFDIYGRVIKEGRSLVDSDKNLQMNPAVINENAWKAIGKPSLASHPRIWLSKDHTTAVTVVGVVKNVNIYDSVEIYVHSGTWPYVTPIRGDYMPRPPELGIVAPADQAKDAAKISAAILQGNLGSGYKVNGHFDEGAFDRSRGTETAITTVVAAIGGIVILLGALGLLTVSIVTVKTRVREIGIRRAVGASAKRIFFSVFLESVVATTVAGFFGVVASILTIRCAPLELAGIDLGGVTWGYPMQAALLGVLISASVGALCGIIPATTAVRMRPIDAIRF